MFLVTYIILIFIYKLIRIITLYLMTSDTVFILNLKNNNIEYKKKNLRSIRKIIFI